MDFQLEKCLQGMTIEEEEDKPIILSNQPQFYAIERNSRSIKGRFLNPDNQRMTKWILEMPRIWRLYDRVRGIALSRDHFQFIFNNEADLLEVLKTCVWTHDDWCVVMERWIEDPPLDYLGFLPVWIRLRNIPFNHYTQATIATIASRIGKIIEFPFEEEQAQSRDFVRVRVRLDVSKPLRNFKEVQTPTGSLVKIGIDYERIRKRCFHCQRLTHDKSNCPSNQPLETSAVLLEIAAPPPRSTKPISSENLSHLSQPPPPSSPKLLADAIKVSKAIISVPSSGNLLSDVISGSSTAVTPFVFSSGCCDVSSSGFTSPGVASGKKTRSWARKSKEKKVFGQGLELESSVDSVEAGLKRKCVEKGKGVIRYSKRPKDTVVPSGPPQDQ